MKRAQIYLEEGEYEAVRQEAFQHHTSISAVLRELVQMELLGKPNKLSAKGLDGIIGMVRDKKTDVAVHHDDYLWGDAA